MFSTGLMLFLHHFLLFYYLDNPKGWAQIRRAPNISLAGIWVPLAGPGPGWPWATEIIVWPPKL